MVSDLDKRPAGRRWFFAAWLLLVALGSYFVGRQVSPDDREPTREQVTAKPPQSGARADQDLAGAEIRTHVADVPAAVHDPLPQKEPFVLDLDRIRTHRGDLEFRLALLDMNVDEVEDVWDALKEVTDYADVDDFRRASATLARLAELDPALALATVEDAGTAKYRVIASVVSGWARQDPDGALEWIETEADPRMKEGAVAAVLDAMGDLDREGTLELYHRAVEEGRLEAGEWNMGRMFADWAKAAPQEAMARALTLRETTDNDSAVDGVLSAWALSAPDGGIEWIRENMEGDARADALRTLLGTWSEGEPRAAAEFILTAPERDSFQGELWQALGIWSDTDFAAASGWVDAIADAELQDAARAELVRRAEHPFDSESFRYALEHLDRPGMFDAVKGHAGRLAAEDPEAALVWADEYLDDPQQRREFIADVFDTWGDELPSDAAKNLDRLPADATRLELHQEVARSWAETEADAARDWVEELPPGPERDRAVEGLVDGWVQKDIPGAGRWIQTFPPGVVRDDLSQREALANMGKHAIQHSVDAARRIDDPFLRELTFEIMFKMWIRDRSKVADARPFILESPDISEGVRWRILHRMWIDP